jgi:hypothetical protein
MMPLYDKQHRKENDHKQNLSIIEYPLLLYLHLFEAHDHYLEQFLIHTETSLPNHFSLYVTYDSLKRVTHNFKRNATRINSAKVDFLYTIDDRRFPKHFKDYFPCADVNV